MSAYSGPEIPNDGLVFAYDMNNSQKSWIGGDVSSGYYFNGRLSNVKCYNAQITDSSIQQNFNALKGRFGI